jgi:hypothetical protein
MTCSLLLAGVHQPLRVETIFPGRSIEKNVCQVEVRAVI